MSAPAFVDIDLGALVRNYLWLTKAAAPGTAGAVVKANAYGLGVAPVARELAKAGCRNFFVATPAEGVALRRVVADAGILVLEGLCGAAREELVAASLIPVLNTRADCAAWGSAGPAALMIDTGMSRLGLAPDELAAIRSAGESAPDVRYLMTHFACADEPGHALNAKQLERFESVRSLWPDAMTSIGNSAGLLRGAQFGGDLARPGIALYGANPFVDEPNPLEPVVTVRARILQLREIAAGTTVGYGASFTASGAMRLATVAIGYADGYLRSLSNCGIAEVAGLRVPVVGRVSMDLVCLDVTTVPRDQVAEGDFAVMLGGAVPLEELAALAGTINYELLTALGPRLERRYLNAAP